MRIIGTAPVSETTEAMKSLLRANRLIEFGSVDRQTDLVLSWVRVAFQQGNFTKDTIKNLAKDGFNGAVAVVLPKEQLQHLYKPENFQLLQLAVRATVEWAGISADSVSVRRQLGGFLTRDKVIVSFPSEDDANQVKRFSTDPKLV